MAIRALDSTDAFVVTDFGDAPATGVVRRGRKILQSSATDLARSASYTFANFEMTRSGASAGINAEGDDAEGAVAAFCAELVDDAESGALHLRPGKGLTADQLAPLSSVSASGHADPERCLVAGIVAAAAWAVGGSLDGRRVAIEETTAGPAPSSLATAIELAGGVLVTVPGLVDKPWSIWAADADIILTGSKPGVLTHKGAPSISASAIVPWGQIPVTTKALAGLLTTGHTTVVPDFVSIGGGLVCGYMDGDDDAIVDQIESTVTETLDAASAHDDGVLIGACVQAEAFMGTWRDELPFGRPLAA